MSAGRRDAVRVGIEASLWSADPGRRHDDLASVAHLADLVHIDVGDGDFAPPLFTPEVLEGVTLPAHVHIMATRSLPLVRAWAAHDVPLITVHAETGDLSETITAIREAGLAAGLALTLDSPPDIIVPYLDVVATIVMVGTPLGTQGTTMDAAARSRMRAARALVDAHPNSEGIRLVADGGIRMSTVCLLADAGADAIVAGSLLFSATNRAETAAWMRQGGHGAHPGQSEIGERA